MSLVATAAVKVLGDEVTTFTEHCITPVFVASITFSATDTIWLTNGADNTELPAGATTDVYRMREPTPRSSSINPSELSTTIGGGSIEVVDINGTFTSLIQAKKLSGVGSRKAKVKLHEVCKGETVTDANLTHTLEWYNQSYSPGVVTLELKELIYTTKETVLNASTAKLAKNHAITDTKLRLFDTGGADISAMFPVFAHTSKYSNQRYDGKEGSGLIPTQAYSDDQVYNTTHEAFGYVRIKDTGAIICHSGFSQYDGSVWEATIIEAGALGTTDSDISIGEDVDAAENFPDVEEVIYAEETGPEWVSFIQTGTSINGNRVFPWGLDIDRDDIDLAALATLANTPQTVIRVITSESQKGKEFLQDEILPIIGAFIDTRKNGKLSLTMLQTPTVSATPKITLDHENSEVSSSLTIERDEIYNEIAVYWGYNEESDSFKYRTVNNYLDSAALYGNTETKEIELKWLQPGMQTDAALRTIIDRIAMQYAFERLTLKVKALPTMRYLRKGDVVICDYDGLRDSASEGSHITLKRPMLIKGVQLVKGTRQAIYTLVGYTKRPKTGSTATDVQHLSLEQIQENGTRANINTVCNITNNEIVNPTTPVVPGKYFYSDDLTAINTTAYDISGYGGIDLWLPSDKHFQDNSANGWIDGKGKGIHIGGKGAVTYASGVTSAATSGERGFFGSNTGGGGVRISSLFHAEHDDYNWGRRVESLNNGAETQALYDDTPDLELRMENGVILGLPDDMSGSGGGGGGWSVATIKPDRDSYPSQYIHNYVDGADGGRGGAWFRLLCGSFGFANGTQLDLSGGDAENPSLLSGLAAGPASGGAPGVMQIILPRGATPPNLETYVKAEFGSSGVNIGDRLSSGVIPLNSLSGINHSYYTPTATDNRSSAATIVSEIPIDAVPEEPISAFTGEDWRADVDSLKDDLTALFNTTMRSSVTVHYQDNEPTGATDLDYWAELDDLDPEDRPTMWQYINDEWSLCPNEDAHAQLIAANYASSTQAERAQITADGKSKTIKTEEEDQANWPQPSGYGDLLYVIPLSQVYRCEDGASWDTDDSYVDELAMPTSANIIHDPTFDNVANKNKRTWSKATEGNVTGIVDYRNGHGEGNGPGALIQVYLGQDGDYAEVTAEHFHPAKRGDIFMLSARVKNRAGRSRGLTYIRLRLFDADKNEINTYAVNYGVFGRVLLTDVVAVDDYVTISQSVELEHPTLDFTAVNYIKASCGCYGYFGGTNPTGLECYSRFDYISVERANIHSLSSGGFGDTSINTTDGFYATIKPIDVYDTNDVFDVYFDIDAWGNSAETIDIVVASAYSGGEERVILENEAVYPLPKKRQLSGKATFSGLPIGTSHFRIKLEMSGAGQYSVTKTDVRITRFNGAE